MNRLDFLRRALALLAGLGLAPLLRANDAGDFFQAVRRNDAGALRRMLTAGMNPNLRDADGNSGLHIALQEGALDTAVVLLGARRIQPDQRNAADETPLMIAALRGHTDMVRRLIGQGAVVGKSGWAPLHYAATGGHLEIMRVLLDYGIDINARSPNDTTPLMMAAMYGTPEAVKLLVQAGADATLVNQKGLSALDFAQQAQRQNSAELIVEALRRAQGVPRGSW